MSIQPFDRRHDRLGPPEPGTSAPSGPLPIRRFKVVLHRVTGQDLMFLARVVMELTRLGDAEAEHRMWQVHYDGHALVLVTHFERAELYAEQFTDRGLSVSIEPV
jgi:ATP-dependent Clp protease adaptor protein ClpS